MIVAFARATELMASHLLLAMAVLALGVVSSLPLTVIEAADGTGMTRGQKLR